MSEESYEQALRKRIEEKPQHARATAQLACVLIDRARATGQRECLQEAIELAHRAIEIAPQKPFGYGALSEVDPVFEERMKALRQAILLSEGNPDHDVTRIGFLARLLEEPREEEARKVKGEIPKGSEDHPKRKDLTVVETAVYEKLENKMKDVWARKELVLDKVAVEFLAMHDYKLGMFFRKRLPSDIHRPRAIHHLQRAIQKLPENHPKITVVQFWLGTLDETQVVSRCPSEYVVDLYSTFAETFDDLLVGKLGYETPTLLREFLQQTVPIRPGKWKTGADLGCGTGLAGLAFRDCVQELIGIDLSPQMVEKARERDCYDRLLVGDVTTALKENDELSSFDLVFACDVFVYIGDLSQVFANVFESLSGNGLFVFSTELLANAAPPDVPFQLHACARFAHSRTYIETLAEKTGFMSLAMKQSAIRKNQGEDVQGLLVVLQRPA